MMIPFQNTYAKLPEAFFERTKPVQVAAPELIAYNEELAGELGITVPAEDRAEVFSGNLVPQGAEPLAMAYSGHQFGGFSPTLGDGRAILLGEVAGKDVQLKGAGRTPFSRRGDGRSALGPVLREYLLSEAMFALGVPTTRALAAVWSGEEVVRQGREPGGVLTRVARSHLRVGTVQYFAARRDEENLRTLVEYATQRLYPGTRGATELLEAVVRSQAKLVAQWMGIGFIHGVMNTDNVSLSGETIDYGPCAFMDAFDPQKKFSFIDEGGRYRYENQPGICLWNLSRLAEALLPVMEEDSEGAEERAKEILGDFGRIFEARREEIFCRKLGVLSGGWELGEKLLNLMAEGGVDFTRAFRLLGEDEKRFRKLFSPQSGLSDWLSRWGELEPNPVQMLTVNPAVIPRNHKVEEVIQAGLSQDFRPFHLMMGELRDPYRTREEREEFARPPEAGQEVTATFCGT